MNEKKTLCFLITLQIKRYLPYPFFSHIHRKRHIHPYKMKYYHHLFVYNLCTELKYKQMERV